MTNLQLAPPALSGSSRSRRSDIQGLRAVAVISVVLYHVGFPIPGGFVGVDVFFVISGFVITAMLIRERAQRNSIKLGHFYWRRFLRLTPALALLVTVTILGSAFILSPLGSQQVAGQTGVGAMLLSANYVIASVTGGYFDAPADLNPLLHTWSLSVEEQFYLVLPALLLLGFLGAARFRRLGWLPIGIVTGLGVGSLALLALGLLGVTFPGVSVPPSFFSPFTRVWEFVAGALLALTVGMKSVKEVPRPVAAATGWLGLGLVFSSFFVIDAEMPFPGPMTLLPVVGTILVLMAGSWRSQPVGQLLSTRPMVRIGDWSYSIYLWHWPFIVFAGALFTRSLLILSVAAALSLIPALASYRWVETPLRQFSQSDRRQALGIVAATMIPPLVLSGGLVYAANQGFWTTKGQELLIRSDIRFGEADGCVGPLPDLLPAIEDCTYNADGMGPALYLVGDSYAGQLTDALAIAATETDSPFIPRTSGGCPFGALYVQDNTTQQEFSPDCSRFNQDVLSWLEGSEPGVVLISNADFYVRDPAFSMGTEEQGVTSETDEKVRILEEGLVDAVARLEAADHKVTLVQPIPNFRLSSDAESQKRWSGFSECPTLLLFLDGCQLTAPESFQEVRNRQRPVWSAVASAARKTGARILDFTPDLCPADRCPVQQGQTVMYSNYVHLSPEGSRKLAPRVVDHLQGVFRSGT